MNIVSIVIEIKVYTLCIHYDRHLHRQINYASARWHLGLRMLNHDISITLLTIILLLLLLLRNPLKLHLGILRTFLLLRHRLLLISVEGLLILKLIALLTHTWVKAVGVSTIILISTDWLRDHLNSWIRIIVSLIQI